jgi:outer membrane receptor protein involved in Fe transport
LRASRGSRCQDLFDRRVSTALVIYNLVARSETTYDPDVGQDSAGPGSHRSGYEINVAYHTLPWLDLYASYSGGRARYSSPFDDGTGHIGEYLPNAPFAIGSFNAYVRHLGAWSGGIAYRYLGAYPLTSGACSDQAVRADFPGLTTCAQAPTPKGELFGSGYGEWSAEVHYALRAGWSIALAGYNLLDKKANAMEYYYVDRLPAEGPDGIADLHFHPLEPISLRVTIAKRF